MTPGGDADETPDPDYEGLTMDVPEPPYTFQPDTEQSARLGNPIVPLPATEEAAPEPSYPPEDYVEPVNPGEDLPDEEGIGDELPPLEEEVPPEEDVRII